MHHLHASERDRRATRSVQQLHRRPPGRTANRKHTAAVVLPKATSRRRSESADCLKRKAPEVPACQKHFEGQGGGKCSLHGRHHTAPARPLPCRHSVSATSRWTRSSAP